VVFCQPIVRAIFFFAMAALLVSIILVACTVGRRQEKAAAPVSGQLPRI